MPKMRDEVQNRIAQSNKVPQSERLTELRRLGETIGLWNISHRQMAEQFHVSTKTLQRDIKKIFRESIAQVIHCGLFNRKSSRYQQGNARI